MRVTVVHLDQRFSTVRSRPGNGSWKISNGSWTNFVFYFEWLNSLKLAKTFSIVGRVNFFFSNIRVVERYGLRTTALDCLESHPPTTFYLSGERVVHLSKQSAAARSTKLVDLTCVICRGERWTTWVGDRPTKGCFHVHTQVKGHSPFTSETFLEMTLLRGHSLNTWIW